MDAKLLALAGTYLAEPHLQGREHIVEIAKVEAHKFEKRGKKQFGKVKVVKKPVLFFRGKDLPLGLTARVNLETVIDMYGRETDDWIGKRLCLYPTTCEAFGNKNTPCIRIKRASSNGKVEEGEFLPEATAAPPAADQPVSPGGEPPAAPEPQEPAPEPEQDDFGSDEPAAKPTLPDEIYKQLTDGIGENAIQAHSWLLKNGWLEAGDGIEHLTTERAQKILNGLPRFLRTINK